MIGVFKKAVDKKINSHVQKIFDTQIAKITDEIERKTIIYSALSLLGIFLILTNLPKPIFYTMLFIIICTAGWLVIDFIQSLRTWLKFLDNFERNIKKWIKQGVDKQEESIIHNVGLWLSGRSNQDIENIAIAYFVKQLIRWFRKNKTFIIVRAVAYTIAVILFKEIATDIFFIEM